MPRARGARATRSSRLPETFEMQGHLIESYHHIDDLPRLSSEPKKRPRHVTRGAVAAERKAAAAVAAATAAAPISANSPRSTRRTRASFAAAAAAAATATATATAAIATAVTPNASAPPLTPAPTNPNPAPLEQAHPPLPSATPNPVPCRVCLKSNTALKIIRCSMCRKGIHTFCLNPPMMDLPNSASWKCFKCKRNAIALKKEKRMILRDALETYSALCTDDYVDKVIDAASVDAATIAPGLVKPANTRQRSPSRPLIMPPNNHNHSNLDSTKTRAHTSDSFKPAQAIPAVIPIKHASPASAQPPQSTIPVDHNTVILRVPKDLMLDELDFDQPLPPLQGPAASQPPQPPPPKRRRVSKSSKNNKQQVPTASFPIQQEVTAKHSTSRRFPRTTAPKKRKPRPNSSYASPSPSHAVVRSRPTTGNTILSPTKPSMSPSQPTHAAQARSSPPHGNTLNPVIVPDYSSSSESDSYRQQLAAPCKASHRNSHAHRRQTALHQTEKEATPAQNANPERRQRDRQEMRHLPLVKRYTLDKSKPMSSSRKSPHSDEPSQNHSPSFTFLSPKAAVCDVPPRPIGKDRAASAGSTRNSSKRVPQIPCSLSLAPQQEPRRRIADRKTSSFSPSDQELKPRSQTLADKQCGTVARSAATTSASKTSLLSRRRNASIAPSVANRGIPKKTNVKRDENRRRNMHTRRGAQHSKDNGNIGRVEVRARHVPGGIGKDKIDSTPVAARGPIVSHEPGSVERSPEPEAPVIDRLRKGALAAASNPPHISLPIGNTMGSSAPQNTSGPSVRTSGKDHLLASVPAEADLMNAVAEPPAPSEPWTKVQSSQNRMVPLAHPSIPADEGCASELISGGCVPRSEKTAANRSPVTSPVVASTLKAQPSSPTGGRRSFRLSNVHPSSTTTAQMIADMRKQPTSVHPPSTEAGARRTLPEVSPFTREPSSVQNQHSLALENIDMTKNQAVSLDPKATRVAINTGRSPIQSLVRTKNRNCGTELPRNARPTLSHASGEGPSKPSVQPMHKDQTVSTIAPSKNDASAAKAGVDSTSRGSLKRSGNAKTHELHIAATEKVDEEDARTQRGPTTPADKAVCKDAKSSPHVDVPRNESTDAVTRNPVDVKELQWDAKREALLAFAQVQRKLAGNMQSKGKTGSNEGSQVPRHMSRNLNVPETELKRMEITALATSSRLQQSTRHSANDGSKRKGSISSLLHVNPKTPTQLNELNGSSPAHHCDQPNPASNRELNVTGNCSHQNRGLGFQGSSSLRPEPGYDREQKRATLPRDSYDTNEDHLRYQTSPSYRRAPGPLSASNKASDSIHSLKDRHRVPSSADLSFRHRPTRPKGGFSSFSQGHQKQRIPKAYALANNALSGNPFNVETYQANGNIYAAPRQSRYHLQRESNAQSLPSANNLRLPRPESSGQNKFRPYDNASDDMRRLAPVAFPLQGPGSATHPCGSPPAIEPMEMPPFGRPGDPIRYNDQPAKKYRSGSPSPSVPADPTDKSRAVRNSSNGLFNVRVDAEEMMAPRDLNYNHHQGFPNMFSSTPSRHKLAPSFGIHVGSVAPNQATDTRVREPGTELANHHPAESRRTVPIASVARPRRFSVPYVQPETRRAQFEQGKALAFVGTSQGGHGLTSRRFNDIGLRTDSPMLHRSAAQRPTQRMLGLASVPDPRLSLQIRGIKDQLPDLNTNSDRYPHHHTGLQASGTVGRGEIAGTTLDQAPQLDSLPDSGLSLSKQIRALASQCPERGSVHTNIPCISALRYGGVSGENPSGVPEISRPQGSVLTHPDAPSGSLVRLPLSKGPLQEETPRATTTVASRHMGKTP